MRVVVQALLPGKPEQLAAEARVLADAAVAEFPADYAALGSQGFEEPCPACAAPIGLVSVADAQCARGHLWGMCSS